MIPRVVKTLILSLPSINLFEISSLLLQVTNDELITLLRDLRLR